MFNLIFPRAFIKFVVKLWLCVIYNKAQVVKVTRVLLIAKRDFFSNFYELVIFFVIFI